MVCRVEGVREASVGTFAYETAIIKIRIWPPLLDSGPDLARSGPGLTRSEPRESCDIPAFQRGEVIPYR